MIETIFSLPKYIFAPIVFVGYSLACLGAGIMLFAFLFRGINHREHVPAGTALATGFILGQGILASLWLLLALGGWLSFRVVAFLSFILVVGGLYFGRGTFTGFRNQVAVIWRQLREDSWGWQLIAGLTVLLCLLWITSLGRPLFGDGTAFYFALGKFVAASQRLIPMPGFEGFTNIGLQGELHFAAMMILHSPEAAKLFSWPTIAAGGVMLASIGRMTGMGRRGQWLTLAILFSSSAVIWLSGDGKVDLFGAALGLAAYYWVMQIRFWRAKPVFFLTGLFSGFAIIAKLSYAPVMVPSVGLLVLWGYANEFRPGNDRRSTFKSLVAGSLMILGGLIVAAIPHLIKNGLLYHNPISPIGSSGMGWLNQTWFGQDITRRILLTYPLALSYGSYWAQYGNLSPLLLAFLPLAIVLPAPRSLVSSPLAAVTLAALTGVGAWILYNPSVFSPRYILAVLLLLILLPARSAEYASLNEQKPRLLAFGVTACTLVTLSAVGLYFLDLVFFPQDTVRYLTRGKNECDRDGMYCNAMEKLNKRADAGDRIYLASYQRYWFRGDLLQCLSSANDAIPAEVSGDDLWLALYEKGFKFLFIDTSTHIFMLERLDMEHLPQWVELAPLYDQEPLYVYHIKFKAPPSISSPFICRRTPSSSTWEITSP